MALGRHVELVREVHGGMPPVHASLVLMILKYMIGSILASWC